MTLVPVRIPSGGDHFSSSYLQLYDACPRKWFNRYYRPKDEDEEERTGLDTHETPLPFITGSLFHEGLETYYRSGCKKGKDTGKYDVVKALARVDKIKDEMPWYSDETKDQEVALVKKMLGQYAMEQCQDFPEIQVKCDSTGDPIVERQFAHKIGYSDHIFTCIPDMIIEHNGFLKVMEHKTSSPSFAAGRVRSIGMDAQITGELWTIMQEFPGDPIDGVMINVIKKGHKTGRMVIRDTAKRTEIQMERWRLATIDSLKRLDDAIDRFETFRDTGMEIEPAADIAFPLLGIRTNTCYAYFKECEFMDLCKAPPERVPTLLNLFKKREAR